MAISKNNLVALNQFTYNQASPFAEMIKRTSDWEVSDIYGLNAHQRCAVAWGDEITNHLFTEPGKLKASSNKIEATLFSIFNALLLRQKHQLVLPIQIGEEFYIGNPSRHPNPMEFVIGSQLLKQIGKEQYLRKDHFADLAEIRDLLEVSKEDYFERIWKMGQDFKLDTQYLQHSLFALVAAKKHPELKCLVAESTRFFLESTFEDLPENLVFVGQWVKYFDFNPTFEDVYYIFQELQQATKTPKGHGIKLVEGVADISLIFDNEHEFLLTDNGVYQKSRMRRFNNILLINESVGIEGERVLAENITLMNSFSTFIYGVVVGSAKLLKEGKYSQLVKKLVSGDLVPLVADDEVGIGDADRQQYEKFVTVERRMPTGFPFSLLNGKVTFPGNSLGDMRTAKQFVEYAALRTFNLVRMPKGQFIDGRMSCVQLPHIHPDFQTKFIREIFAEQFGFGDDFAIASWAKKEFDLDSSLSEAQTFEYLKNNLVVATSSKLAKLIKRTAMYASLVGELEGGESRGFMPFGQKEISVNNWVVEACISEHAMFPAGVAVYWGEKPVLKVPHTSSQTPNIVPLRKEGDSVVVDYPHSTPVLRNGWWEIELLETVYLNRGDVYASVPYMVGADNYFHYLVNKTDDCELVSVRWRQAKAFGNDEALQIQTTTITRENQIKARNNIKAMMTRYNPECIHNELNGAARDTLDARAIFFADTNKWLDLLMQNVDVAALTAIKNQDEEGLELIKVANEAAGVKSIEYLEWSPMLALLGTYKTLIEWFETKFGRDVWFKHNDGIAGDWVYILRKMYASCPKGWQSVSKEFLDSVVPATATNVVGVQDADDIAPGVNILIFFEDNGEHFFYQRAWSYCGTEEAGAVWQAVKAELSSVRSIVGATPIMAGSVRSIEKYDPEFAKRLTEDNAIANKATAFHLMSNGKTPVGVEAIALTSDEAITLLSTEDNKEIVNDRDEQNKVLLKLATAFNKTWFSVDGITINLAAIYKQDSNGNYTGGGLADLVTNLFVQVINGVKPNTKLITQLIKRIKGALKTVCTSDGFNKSSLMCREGVQAKTTALPGIPSSQLFVIFSDRFDSVYKTMQRVFNTKDIDGIKVASGRAPLTSPAFMTVKVIYENDEIWGDLIETDAVYISPIAAIADRGDNDGDNRSFTDSSDADPNCFPLLTPEGILADLKASTGTECLELGGQYFGDQFNVASRKKIKAKRSPQKNFSTLCIEKESPKALPIMLERSVECFMEYVGWVHGMFLRTDIFTSLTDSCGGALISHDPEWTPKSHIQNEALVSIFSDIYEVPLGGYDPGAYNVCRKGLIPIVKDGKRFSPEYVSGSFYQLLDKAGMNSASHKDIYAGAVTVSECADSNNNKDFLVDSVSTLLTACAQQVYNLSKGKCVVIDVAPKTDEFGEPMGKGTKEVDGCMLVPKIIGYLKDKQELKQALIANSTAMEQLFFFIDTQYPAMIGQQVNIDDSFFNI
jgi:hypothetical protein